MIAGSVVTAVQRLRQGAEVADLGVLAVAHLLSRCAICSSLSTKTKKTNSKLRFLMRADDMMAGRKPAPELDPASCQRLCSVRALRAAGVVVVAGLHAPWLMWYLADVDTCASAGGLAAADAWASAGGLAAAEIVYMCSADVPPCETHVHQLQMPPYAVTWEMDWPGHSIGDSEAPAAG